MLSPYRVLDLSDERGHLAGRILADLGADVIQIEKPGAGGLRSRGPFLGDSDSAPGSLPWLAANSGKRSWALDLADSERDRMSFRRLVEGADVVIETARPGTMARMELDYESLRAMLPKEHPGLIYCSMTPFGQVGPYSKFLARDLVAVAMGGNASLTGERDSPPLVCGLPTAYMHAGAEAVVGILLGLWSRPTLGRGQVVDVSMRESQLVTLMGGAGQYGRSGGPRIRSGYRTGPTREIWKCADGWITYGLRGGPARAASLAATVEYMAEFELAPRWLREMDWKNFNPAALTASERSRIEQAFGAFFRTRSRRELYEQALARRILLAPCNDASEILEQAQLRDRNFFVRIESPDDSGTGSYSIEQPAFFARSSACQIGSRTRAASRNEHGEVLGRELDQAPRKAREEAGWPGLHLNTRIGARGCLEGLRVLELGSGAAGPLATAYLATQGASVIRIESSRRPDFLRLLHVTPENRDESDILERSPMFALFNANKRSLAVNMKTSEGIALVRRLVDEWADVLSENFSPGVMERWGLDYSTLAESRPDLVMVSSCLFGQTGPQRHYPGFGGQGAAISGFNHMTGWPGREALGPYGTITDSLSPRFVATATLAALLFLRRTGKGQHLDISQIETGVYCLSEMIVRCSAGVDVMERNGNAREDAAPHGIYRCRDGSEDGAEAERWIAISIWTDSQWTLLGDAMGRPGWAAESRFASAEGRMRDREALEENLSAWTREREAEVLMFELQALGIEAGVVRDLRQLQEDPQLIERKHFVPLSHEVLGRLRFERPGFRLSESPGAVETPGPRLGADTRDILSEILGLTETEVDELIRREVAV